MRRQIFLILLGLLFVYIIAPFILPIALGAVIASLLYPTYLRLNRRIKPVWSSALLSLSVTFLFLIPIAFVLFMSARAAIAKLPELKAIKDSGGAQAWIQIPVIQKIISFLKEWFSIEVNEIISAIQDVAENLGALLADVLGKLITSVPSFVMYLIIIIFSIFFLLLDGHRLRKFFHKLGIFPAGQEDKLIDYFPLICRSLMLSSLLVGIIQSVIFTISCLTVGMPNAAISGLLVFFTSFIPLVGSSPITLGMTAYAFIFGTTTQGVVLLLTALIVAISDNVIRSMVLKEGVDMHPLLAFVAVLGGIVTLGFPGIFLGPIIAGYFVLSLKLLLNTGKKES